jgi:glycosyltransferase involved in cell wall biosynthesis
MATCEGETYLPAQLASLLGQVRLPDEMVIVDDASDDNTLDLLQQFAERAPFKVRIIDHDARTGSTEAFSHGIAEASGDMIALCDQDDLWYPHKLSRLEGVLEDRPSASYVFTDASLIDGADRTLPGRLWQVRKFTPRLLDAVARDAFGQLAQRFLVTGCTMAFRSELRSVALPVPVDVGASRPPVVHDRWLSLVLAAVGRVIALDEPLMAYRIHARQQIGIANVSSRQHPVARVSQKILAPRDYTQDLRDQQIELIVEVRDRVESSGLATEAILARIDDVLGYLRFRRDQPPHRSQRVVPVARQALLGTYSRHSRGLGSIAVDLLRP